MIVNNVRDESFVPEISLGTLLKDKRVKLGKTIDDMATETKIRLLFIDAMERDAFDELPGNVYTLGFLKIYAQSLDIPEEKVVELYNAQLHQKIEPLPYKIYMPAKKKSFLDWKVALISLGSMGGLIYYSLMSHDSSLPFQNPSVDFPAVPFTSAIEAKKTNMMPQGEASSSADSVSEKEKSDEPLLGNTPSSELLSKDTSTETSLYDFMFPAYEDEDFLFSKRTDEASDFEDSSAQDEDGE